jgi:hypothetical protein
VRPSRILAVLSLVGTLTFLGASDALAQDITTECKDSLAKAVKAKGALDEALSTKLPPTSASLVTTTQEPVDESHIKDLRRRERKFIKEAAADCDKQGSIQLAALTSLVPLTDPPTTDSSAPTESGDPTDTTSSTDTTESSESTDATETSETSDSSAPTESDDPTDPVFTSDPPSSSAPDSVIDADSAGKGSGQVVDVPTGGVETGYKETADR